MALLVPEAADDAATPRTAARLCARCCLAARNRCRLCHSHPFSFRPCHALEARQWPWRAPPLQRSSCRVSNPTLKHHPSLVTECQAPCPACLLSSCTAWVFDITFLVVPVHVGHLAQHARIPVVKLRKRHLWRWYVLGRFNRALTLGRVEPRPIECARERRRCLVVLKPAGDPTRQFQTRPGTWSSRCHTRRQKDSRRAFIRPGLTRLREKPKSGGPSTRAPRDLMNPARGARKLYLTLLLQLTACLREDANAASRPHHMMVCTGIPLCSEREDRLVGGPSREMASAARLEIRQMFH